jgi:excisionase family DNA binding protein
MMHQLDLLTVPESAALLRLKTSTIRSWRLKRRIPFVKIGGKVLVRRSDIEEFVAKNVVPAKTEAKQ